MGSVLDLERVGVRFFSKPTGQHFGVRKES